jgi:hypothetical protein
MRPPTWEAASTDPEVTSNSDDVTWPWSSEAGLGEVEDKQVLGEDGNSWFPSQKLSCSHWV